MYMLYLNFFDTNIKKNDHIHYDNKITAVSASFALLF